MTLKDSLVQNQNNILVLNECSGSETRQEFRRGRDAESLGDFRYQGLKVYLSKQPDTLRTVDLIRGSSFRILRYYSGHLEVVLCLVLQVHR